MHPSLKSNTLSLIPYTKREKLLDWYQSAKRDLPWRAFTREQANPYHVMVSEFMLQQTTVQAVIPYFNRFIETFPTIDSLAAASLDHVYVLWQGLGYYSRAKNLHKSAQRITELGVFPSDVKTLSTLPGVGPYTSAAISSIAFNQPVIPIDGNVMRVFSRLFMLTAPKGPLLYKDVENHVHAFHGTSENDHLAQAIMELGAMICRPKSPTCHQCPLQTDCLAFQNACTENFPTVIEKSKLPQRSGTSFVIENSDGDILFIKRPSKGLFANMYICPTTSFENADPNFLNFEKVANYIDAVKHTFTHFSLTLSVVLCRMVSNEDIIDESCVFIPKADIGSYGIPKLMHKVLDTVYKQKTTSLTN